MKFPEIPKVKRIKPSTDVFSSWTVSLWVIFFQQKIVVVAWINFLKLISLIQINLFVLLIKNSDFKKFKKKFAI